MKSRYLFAALLSVLLVAALFYLYVGGQVPAGQSVAS
jgi:hypothetical protein